MNIIKNGKIIGSYFDKEYVSDRKPKHFMVKYQGFGISADIIERLMSLGIEEVKIIYHGVKGTIVYTTTLEAFHHSKKTYNFLGEDLQKFVSVKDMEVRE